MISGYRIGRFDIVPLRAQMDSLMTMDMSFSAYAEFDYEPSTTLDMEPPRVEPMTPLIADPCLYHKAIKLCSTLIEEAWNKGDADLYNWWTRRLERLVAAPPNLK